MEFWELKDSDLLIILLLLYMLVVKHLDTRIEDYNLVWLQFNAQQFDE